MEAEGRRIRVIVAEDTFLVREVLTEIVGREPALELVRTCDDRDSLEAAIAQDPPDVVVTDIRMPPTGTDEGLQVARTLRDSHPDVGVVVLSQFVEPSYPLALLRDGSSGRAYLLKERVHDQRQLVAAIEAVAAGGSMIDSEVVEVLVQAQTRAAESPLAELTAREREVLAELATGKSNAAIAESLTLTKRAVEKHINSIFMKLNLPNSHDVSRRVMATLMFLAGEDGRE